MATNRRLVLITANVSLIVPAGFHGLADGGRRQSASWKHTPRGASFQFPIALRSGEHSFLVGTRPGDARLQFDV